jgi:hypothetical protein
MARQAAGQMTLDLFGERPSVPKQATSPVDETIAWLCDSRGCDHDIDPIVRRVFETMPDAFERCKVLDSLSGYCRQDGYDMGDVETFGVLDVTLDYQVVWDRRWAAACGVDKALVGSVHRCDYGGGYDSDGHHRFYDAHGNLLASAVPWYVKEYNNKYYEYYGMEVVE